MSYYVFQVVKTPIVKILTLLESFEQYKQARDYCRVKREELDVKEEDEIKMCHASSQLEAEERLQEKRERPILMEWEK